MIIGLESQFVIFLREVVLRRVYLYEACSPVYEGIHELLLVIYLIGGKVCNLKLYMCCLFASMWRYPRTLARYIFDIGAKVCNLRLYICGLFACMWRYPRTLARYIFDIGAKVCNLRLYICGLFACMWR